jgi:hypothetical protein
MKQEKNMIRKFCIAVFAIFSLMALSIMAASASPPTKSPTAAKKETAKTSQPATAAACDEQVVLNERLTAKVTGTKPAPEAIGKFDFKIEQVVKPLDGHAGAIEHVPIKGPFGHQPVGYEGSFY